MNKIEELTIVELESFLNVTQKLIDNIIREAKMNDLDSVFYNSQKKLDKLNKCRNIIIREINNRLDETFLAED